MLLICIFSVSDSNLYFAGLAVFPWHAPANRSQGWYFVYPWV